MQPTTIVVNKPENQ